MAGKDGCMAAYKAMESGVKVRYLLSFWNRNREGSHEVSPTLPAAQAESLGIPLIRTGFLSYEEEFKRTFRAIDEDVRAKGRGISSAVFGHIRTHGPLVDRICADLAIEGLMPIWNMNSEEIIGELLGAGFEAANMKRNSIRLMSAEVKKLHLPIMIEIDEDGYYIASYPQFKGCHPYGETLDEALENIREVALMCLEDSDAGRIGAPG
ncbi:Dph6-related ATP pyrophosphatase [Candidatus Methanocrinis natronophilus]|uniref:Type II toxin-antitoxin system HicB family antitoxin n=1 Tax=Candidatus Methanocrinis natronophilus TaxID=3033396 RepID=A0ABT5XA21_9EURY|nr:type II toxin-antitoxin system HicB family antitoxin [Candidatus Methanocrinis natronophilus]MDF0591532.1 type II toxin-antitoxin system HicB family antitoxin [Candidatus Methanocrinis natronophilus]